ncbi:VOC family protein [Streptomyces sp. 2A115]|uniref:VOC family protein n=1 Tax=Streptomyces sp. 2A115 TaxID=3457439 RepID=UPI003FD6ABF8
MSYVTSIQPDGTPTWIDLRVPDRERALEFYGALFGWEYAQEPAETGTGLGTTCLLYGRPVAAITQAPATTGFGWNMYFATADCDGTAKRIADAGGTLLKAPTDVGDKGDQGRMAIAEDPVGARFGLWEARAHLGCQVVNEPGSLVRNDLVTADPEPARAFYAAVFDYTLDLNETLPDADFTFLRRKDGHEIGGVFGFPGAPSSAWATTFEVADTDAVTGRALAAGGTTSTPEDSPYGRIATITDPFGVEFSVITRAS